MPPLAALHQRSNAVGDLDRKTAEATAFIFQHADLTGLRVLVVDDEPDTRHLLSRVLSECNAVVASATKAYEALAIFERQASTF